MAPAITTAKGPHPPRGGAFPEPLASFSRSATLRREMEPAAVSMLRDDVDALSELVGGISSIKLYSDSDDDADTEADTEADETLDVSSGRQFVCRPDPRLRKPAAVSVRRRRRSRPKPSRGKVPAPVRTLVVWTTVGLMLPLLGGASSPMRAVLACACLLRYGAQIIGITRVLWRCIACTPAVATVPRRSRSLRSRPPPRATVLAWELWAPRKARRAVAALCALTILCAVTDVVARLTFDLSTALAESFVTAA